MSVTLPANVLQDGIEIVDVMTPCQSRGVRDQIGSPTTSLIVKHERIFARELRHFASTVVDRASRSAVHVDGHGPGAAELAIVEPRTIRTRDKSLLDGNVGRNAVVGRRQGRRTCRRCQDRSACEKQGRERGSQQTHTPSPSARSCLKLSGDYPGAITLANGRSEG